jgi:hypothetical protein
MFTGTNAIQAAIDDCALMSGLSVTNRCVVKVRPGVYTLASPLQMRSFVDVDGSGVEDTLVTSSLQLDRWVDQGPAYATVKMAANSKLSNLKVTNTNARAGLAILISAPANAVTLEHVAVEAKGAGDASLDLGYCGVGIYGGSAANVAMKDITVDVSWSSAVDDSRTTRAFGIDTGDAKVRLDRAQIGAHGSRSPVAVNCYPVNGGYMLIYDSDLEGSTVTGGSGTAAGVLSSGWATALLRTRTRAFGSPAGTCVALQGSELYWGEAQVGEWDGSDCLNKVVLSTANGPAQPASAVASTIQYGRTYVQGPWNIASCWDMGAVPFP